MAIYVKNPEVERKARELAARTGESVTAMLDRALDNELRTLGISEPPPARRTLKDVEAAIERYRKAVRLDEPFVAPEKNEFDALWEIEGLDVSEAWRE